MNRLHKNIRSHRYGMLVMGGAFVGLAVLHLLQIFLGLEEQEFYQKHPIGWWAAVILGLLFISSLAFTLVKTRTVSANIHLRNKSDEYIESVLEDPEYELWHAEARRLLDERHARLESPRKWCKTYAMVSLVVLLVFLYAAFWGGNEHLRLKNGGFANVAGLFVYMATGLFVLMSSGDRIRRIRLRRFKIPLSVLWYSSFGVWLVGSMLWVIHMLDL